MFKRNSDGSWTQMLDYLKYSQNSLMGVLGIAIAPQNSDIVYAAAGQFSYKNGAPVNGEVLKTTDGGKTWFKAGLAKPFGSDDSGKICSEMIAVSPHDINTVYVLTKREGLWKTENGAASWEKVTSFAPSSSVTSGFVEFSKTSSSTIYVSVLGEGMYKSTDSGATWSLTSGTPLNLRQVAQKSDGTLFCTSPEGIHKYQNNAWSLVHQRDAGANGQRAGMCGIDIDPFNQNHIVALTFTGTDGSTGQNNNHIIESTDGGTTWTDRYNDHQSGNSNFVNPSSFANQFTSAPAITFDRKRSGIVYISDWFGVFETGNIANRPITVYRNSKGIENTVSYSVRAIPGNFKVTAGFADIGAAEWSGLESMGERIKAQDTNIQDMCEFDYCESNPEFVVRTGAQFKDGNSLKHTGFEYSVDGGATWTYRDLSGYSWARGTTAAVHILSHVAVSANLNQNGKPTVLISGNDGIYYSDDLGATWNKCSGAPNIWHGLWVYDTTMVSDRVDGDIFYICIENNMYVSRNRGRSFTLVNSNVPDAQRCVQIEASPTESGTVILATGRGAYITRDYGATFTEMGDFEASKVTFGMGEEDPIIYLFDKSDAKTGLYISYDMGVNWNKMDTDGNNFCGITDMDAAKDELGVIYISTRNRGAFSIKLK